MKKFRFLLLIICILPISVFASTNITCERTSSNNYGANKKDVKIDSTNSYKLSSIPCVNANEYIYDFGDVLTDEEEEKLARVFKEFEEKHKMSIVYYSFDYSYSYGQESKLDDYADDFYDLNDFGINYNTYSGVYLYENAYKLGYDSDYDGVDDGFYFNAGAKGEAQLYFYDDRLDESLDVIYNDLKYFSKYEAILEWVEQLEKYYSQGKLKNYKLDSDGNLVKKFTPLYLGYILVAAIATAVMTAYNVNKNKMVALAENANDYTDKNNTEFTNKQDVFISTHTTSYTMSSGSSGGGGGHHSGGGSFSGGHSHGGGRH